MFKKIVKIKYIFFVVLFSFYLFSITYATDDELSKISGYQDTLKKINEQKTKVQNTIKKLNSLKNDMEKYIKELDTQLEELVTELNNTIDQIENLQIQIDDTKEKLDIAETNEKKQYEDMKTRIKFFYERGDITALESILNGNNLSDILTKAEYITSITEYDRKKLNELIKIKNEIEELKEKLVNEQNSLILLRKEESERKADVELLIFEKQKELESTSNQINVSQKELKKLQEDQKAQEDNIRAVEAAIRAREKNNKRVLIGGLIWPLPSSKRITSNFGKRKNPTKGASTNHQGIDIGAPTGDKVIAAASGEVVIAKYSYSAGNYIMINHGSQFFTVYMHLSKMSVKEGDEVILGQKIGEVGSTGYSTGPHLHFGVRKNGTYVDPLNYVN